MGEQEAVAVIEVKTPKEATLRIGRVGSSLTNSIPIIAVQVVNLDVFQTIFTAQGGEGGDRLARLKGAAEIRLIVNRAQERGRMVVELPANRDLIAHEPRLGDRHNKILTLETILAADAETLSGTGEVGPVEEIEVGLLEFGKADQAVDRAEAGTEVERSGLLLLNDDIEVLAPWHQRVLRGHVDLGEVVQVHQTGLADIHERGVEDAARLHRKLSANHLVLGLGVALDINEIHVGLDTLVDAVGEVDLPVTRRGDLGLGDHVDIAAGAVVAADGFKIGTHAVRSVERSLLHLEEADKFLRRHDRRSLNGDLVDAVLRSFRDGDHQINSVTTGKRCRLDIGNAHIGEAPTLVEGADRILVLIHLRRGQTPRLGEEGEDICRLGLHDLEKILRKNRIVAGEGDAADDELRPLIDRENNPHLFVRKLRGLRLDFHIGVVLVLVEFEDLLAVVVDLLVVKGVAGLRGDLLADLGGGYGLGSLDQDLTDGDTPLEKDGDLESACDRLGKDTGVRDTPSRIERLDILFDETFVVGSSGLGRQIIEHTLPAQRRGAHELDIDFLDDRSLTGHLGVQAHPLGKDQEQPKKQAQKQGRSKRHEKGFKDV